MKKYLNERSMCIHNKHTSPQEWFTLYTKFQKIEPRLAKISNFNEQELSFEIEKVNGFGLYDFDQIKKLSIKERRNIMSDVICLWGKLQSFTVDETYIFLHKDFCVNNLMYDTNKKQVKLIDPDAFQKEAPRQFTPIFHGPFIDTLYNIKQWERL